MPRFKRLDVLLLMKQIGLVPIFSSNDIDQAKGMACACADGGARVVEFTNRGDRTFETFTRLEEFCATERPEVVLGVGSVVDAPTAAMFIAAGANFVVGPSLDEETARLCNSRKIAYSPGCGSLTEIHRAEMLGVEICKLFPALEAGGPNFVKMIKGPCPWTELMPTGGLSISEESLKAWFDAGIACIGFGPTLISRELQMANDFPRMQKKIADTLALIKKVRGGN